MQIEIIDATGKLMRHDSVQDGNSSWFFSVFCDGKTDTAVKEQISIVLCPTICKNEEIHSVFVGFTELQGTTGEAIATKMLNLLSW